MKPLELGIVKINYDHKGEIKDAMFRPTMEVPLGGVVEQELRQIGQVKDPDRLRRSADLVMGAWFAKMNEIELADRYEYGIESEITECIKNDEGKIQSMSLKYIFKQIA